MEPESVSEEKLGNNGGGERERGQEMGPESFFKGKPGNNLGGDGEKGQRLELEPENAYILVKEKVRRIEMRQGSTTGKGRENGKEGSYQRKGYERQR